MRVADLMEKDVKCVGPEASLGDVVLSLADAHVSALPVVDRHGRILGVVSATDVLVTEAEAESDEARTELFQRTLVQDLMTPHALTISPDSSIREAAQQMIYGDVHRLFVAEGTRLVGVISTTDIVRAVATGML